MYRLRSMESLIKHHEIENQSIYFSSVQDEDDIYEGKYILYFDGNSDLWEGFLILLNQHIIFNVGICGSEYDKYFDNAMLPSKVEYAYRTFNPEKENLKRFLNLESIKKLITFLSNYKGKIYESFFENIVGKFIVILSIQNNNSFNERLNKKYENEKKWLEDLHKSDYHFVKLLSSIERIFSINNSLDKSKKMDNSQLIRLLDSLNAFSDPQNFNSKSLAFKNTTSINKLIATFLKGLRKIALENCYIASFTSKCNNSRMWSQYTNYNGVCLEFKDNHSLKLRSTTFNINNDFTFHKVTYGRPPEFNFFNVIGRLQMGYFRYIFPKYDFKKDPYDVLKNIKKNYWKWVELPVLFKDPSWKEQEEYRLIEGVSGTFKYDFSELKSVILGNRVSDNDKIKIKNILDKKCKENEIYNFPIYILYRDEASGNLDKKLYIILNRKHIK